jgi:triosephosphate isomerase
MMRRAIIAGNWKMNIGRKEDATAFVRAIRPRLSEITALDVVLCPPFTVLETLSEILASSPIGLGAQNMHWEDKGAHTGEISATMLADICQYVIIGHSERRASGSAEESNQSINQKVAAALDHGLIPIICVGENAKQRKAGETDKLVTGQVRSAFSGLEANQISQCIVAYEPIWAIGTGDAATPADASLVISTNIRGPLSEDYGESVAQELRVQYGGSVNKGNIASFMKMPDIDGALVGGASLKPDFVDLVQNAAATGT